MLGNLCEWVQDNWHPDYHRALKMVRPGNRRTPPPESCAAGHGIISHDCCAPPGAILFRHALDGQCRVSHRLLALTEYETPTFQNSLGTSRPLCTGCRPCPGGRISWIGRPPPDRCRKTARISRGDSNPQPLLYRGNIDHRICSADPGSTVAQHLELSNASWPTAWRLSRSSLAAWQGMISGAFARASNFLPRPGRSRSVTA